MTHGRNFLRSSSLEFTCFFQCAQIEGEGKARNSRSCATRNSASFGVGISTIRPNGMVSHLLGSAVVI